MILIEKFINLTLKQIIDSLYYTVVTDNNANILCMSRNYRELLGVTSEEIEGKPICDIIPTSRIPLITKSKKEEIGFLFELKNGQNVVCNRIPILDNNKLVGVIATATFVNISEVETLNNEIKELHEENCRYKKLIKSFQKQACNEIIGNSMEINRIKETISKIATTDMTVLITGETGTGKEVFSNAIHNLSNRYNQKFVKINCAAIPKDLLESELFGYEAGAFSGANKNGKIGKFELANHGSLLLDEIGEMPMQLQSKLLRVLQEKEMERVGGIKPIKLDVRVICITNQNIEDMIKSGQFRKDLYYRINVMEIYVPPLRERKEDIRPLCTYMIEKMNNKYGLGVTGISEEVFNIFMEYDWDGNIRELEHLIERACVTAIYGDIECIHIEFLAQRIAKDISKYEKPSILKKEYETESLQEFKNRMEKEKILKTLNAVNGNKTLASKVLGIDRGALYNKLNKHNLKST